VFLIPDFLGNPQRLFPYIEIPAPGLIYYTAAAEQREWQTQVQSEVRHSLKTAG
jgi:hypothetical protein